MEHKSLEEVRAKTTGLRQKGQHVARYETICSKQDWQSWCGTLFGVLRVTRQVCRRLGGKWGIVEGWNGTKWRIRGGHASAAQRLRRGVYFLSESGSMSCVTWKNWPDLFLKKRRGAQQSARACLWKSGKWSINKKRESTADPPEIRNGVIAGTKFSSAASVAGLRDV